MQKNETFLVDDGILMVRWRVITVAGVDESRALAAKAAMTGRFVLVGMVGNDTELPAEGPRKHLAECMTAMEDYTTSVNLVLDGSGLRFSAMRSIAATMFLLKGNRRTKIYNSLLDCLTERVPDRTEALMARARASGLIT